ncbi:ephrin-A3b isoform X1 [Xiphias gladius]|uniref:ephrin-A3b isoform X1 n=1 Tax=Xiphias gladius TaxID=8245 RepID=UPI001A9A1C2D|nr:ephrin-A3b isoform X1 [Xiphias gladius]
MALVALSLWVLTSLTWANLLQVSANRHSVYWNSSNIHLRREGYTMQVNVNDYLDIYCPHYNDSQRMVGTGEQYVLYMVSYRGYRNCDPQLGFKRWECNRPHAPHAPIKFSEKFQRYSAFSLGYEFHVGQEYYYISTPTHHHGRSCLRLRVYVCCSTASDVDDEPEPTEPDYTLRPGLKIDDIVLTVYFLGAAPFNQCLHLNNGSLLNTASSIRFHLDLIYNTDGMALAAPHAAMRLRLLSEGGYSFTNPVGPGYCI